MERWQTQLRLRIRGIPWRVKVGFDYEWKAWLLAYDITETDPAEFLKLDIDRQVIILAYGAAAWHLMKHGKNVYFTPEDIAEALLRATKEENNQLVAAMAYARWPEWMRQVKNDKKKEET
ncbi:MAG: hypothetical protein D4R45_04520 [Planctomycetaceae bacterium]|nr:MAG: hypothetical protein D4R45_04520 [Planctomycetaceae bacterium]